MPFEGDNKREKVIVLLTMCFALFMAMLDNTVVNVALPTLSRELGAGVSELQWIVDGYVLAFASLLLTGGIAGDRFGRKKMFMTGLFIFTVASTLCGLSGSTTQLIAARAMQGIGAALLMPGTLSILTVTFPPHERAKAIGMWAGVSGIALALGPTLGGWMIEHIGWQSVFFLNLPIGIIGLLTASRSVRESVAEQVRRLDLVGLLFGTAALFSITYGLIESNQFGWSDPLIVANLAAGALFTAGLLWWERRSDHPMMPLAYYKIPAFAAGNAIAFAISLGMFGAFFFMSMYMQVIRGYSPFESGVRFLPMTAMVILVAPNAGKFAQKHGSRLPMTVGLLLAGTGMLLLSRASLTTPWALVTPVLMILGIGMASVMAPMTAAVMNAVGMERAGLGSAMTNTAREVGGVFGIALLGSLLTTKLKGAFTAAIAGVPLAPAVRAPLIESAGHGRLAPPLMQSLPPEQAGIIQHAFATSFLSGFRLALLVGACILYASAFVAYRFIPTPAPRTVEQPEHAVAH